MLVTGFAALGVAIETVRVVFRWCSRLRSARPARESLIVRGAVWPPGTEIEAVPIVTLRVRLWVFVVVAILAWLRFVVSLARASQRISLGGHLISTPPISPVRPSPGLGLPSISWFF